MRWLIAILVLDLVLAGALVFNVGEAQRADLVFVSGGGHKFLDPQLVTWLDDIRITECLFEPLVRIKLPEMVIEPAAAESYSVDADGLTYTFQLRPTARWSNGDPVTSSDFIFAWRRALMPDSAAGYSNLLWLIDGGEEFFKWRQAQLQAYAKDEKNNLAEAQRLLDEAIERFGKTVGLSAPDDRTLVVRLARPIPYFLQLCAFATYMPVHRASVEPQASLSIDSGRLVQDPYWTRPDRLICNGPYLLARRRFRRDLLLTANPNYWNRAAMGNRSILERIVTNPSIALMLYESGEVDWLPDIPSTSQLAADLVSAGRRDVHVVPGAGTYFYNFNCQATLPDGAVNPLVDPRVRRALSMTIDREIIVKTLGRLGQPPAYTFTPVGAVPGYDPPVEAGARFDPEAARKLLAAAGYDPQQGGNHLEGLSILYNTGFGHELIAQQITRTWKKHLNIDVTLNGQEKSVFGDRLDNHNFIISRAGWFGDYVDPTTFLDKFESSNNNNDAAYSNAEYDQLLKQAAAELDQAKRMKLLRRAEVIMLHDQPIAPIYQYVELNVYDEGRVKNLNPNPWHFRRLELVRVER